MHAASPFTDLTWSAALVEDLVEQLRRWSALADEGAVTARERIDRIRQAERLTSVAAAIQVKETAAFAAAVTPDRPMTADEDAAVRRSIGGQIAAARITHPHRGNRHVGTALALTREMPHTLAALRNGDITEHRAFLMVRETATLSRAHRERVDLELAGRLGSWGDKRIATEAATIGYRLDPRQAVDRRRRGENERRVSLRPAPDTMAYLTALVTMEHAVTIRATLEKRAATAKALGDTRGRGQLMADDFVNLLTAPLAPGAVTAEPAGSAATTGAGSVPVPQAIPAGASVEIHLVMTDRALFDGDSEPALITGYGPLPAPIARRLLRDADPTTNVFIRRLYTDRATGHLADTDPRRRLFPQVARQFLITRDQTCRTAWCDAPIRHADHVTPHAQGGATRTDSGQGLCESCNYLKETGDWVHTPNPDGSITVTTPTGHTTSPPSPPASLPWADYFWPEVRGAGAA